ncbi:hypothetical protein [Bacillus paranthracis]|uniref:hypothetical protein n=1 Tax=Bacillus paranthracis TaxID=2026186 RepID=UPI003CED06F7
MTLQEYLTNKELNIINQLRGKLKQTNNYQDYELIKHHIVLTLKNAIARRKKELLK